MISNFITRQKCTSRCFWSTMYIERELNQKSVGTRDLMDSVPVSPNEQNKKAYALINAFHGCRKSGTTRPKTDFHIAFSVNNFRGETRFESGTNATSSMTMAYQSEPSNPCVLVQVDVISPGSSVAIHDTQKRTL